MHKHLMVGLVAAAAVLLWGCGSPPEPAAPAETAKPAVEQAVAATEAGGSLELTLEELAAYNGKDGKPAYIAVDGVIYDVTDSPKWKDGEHNGYKAGNNLTDAIKNVSPHGVKMLERLKKIGTLKVSQ